MDENLRQSLINSLASAMVQGGQRFDAREVKNAVYRVVDEISDEEDRRSLIRDHTFVSETMLAVENARKDRDNYTVFAVLAGFAQACANRPNSFLMAYALRMADNLKNTTPVALNDDDIEKALAKLARARDQLGERCAARGIVLHVGGA